MKLPSVTIKNLLEAGVHLGHKTFRWNPKMDKFIFGSKKSIHIIDLVQTLEGYKEALSAMENDSALGKFWHDIAVYNSFPPKQRESKLIGTMAHCLEADAWVKKEDVKEKSPYPTKPIQSRKG